ncbi:MAG TPA: diphthine--ammonia ligase [Candidatus Bathyarchaeia archaeon]|nr:diphthine--ammonia ligase [Candidatus Bathyarchaeia archaeon]
MKVAVLYSGGKDSTYATWVAQHQGWDVEDLVTVLPKAVDSLMFHFPNVRWTKLQAEAMGLPHHTIEVADDELLSLREGLSQLKAATGIEGVVTGAVASDYQKSRIDQVCDALALKSFVPLWRKEPKTLVNDLKSAGFKIILSGVGAAGLDESWLGQELTDQRWEQLEKVSRRHGIHLTGEGGEYETFVIDAPGFQKRVSVNKTVNRWDGQSGYLIIEQAVLESKSAN